VSVFQRMKKKVLGVPAEDLYPEAPRDKMWLLGLSAVLEEQNSKPVHDRLYPYRYAGFKALDVSQLKELWDVDSREKLLQMLNALCKGVTTEPMASLIGRQPIAWDLARCANETRHGFCAEYISEQEAWRILEIAGGTAEQHYGSWRDYATDFLTGRQIWFEGAGSPPEFTPMAKAKQSVDRLLDPNNSASPWNRAPWNNGITG
jgi:Protein of unknown function (DUF1266)